MSAKPNYTPLSDTDAKLDIMEHVNQDHLEEVLVITQDYYPTLNITQAHIEDVFVEGMSVNALTPQGSKTLFITFALEGDIEEQILYLAYLAMAKQGKDLIGNKKQYFEVIGKQKLTENMTRLTLQSQTPLPSDYAGYAYGMILKVLNKVPDKQANNKPAPKPVQLAKKYSMQAFLWLLKKAPSTRRQQIVETMNKDIRLYTIRQTWQSDDADFINQGYMDIYTHGQSAGSVWTQKLNVGDIIFSRTETDDKHSHLDTGQAVLIADETAYPALAGILDLWENPLPPHIIILSQQDSEQGYFSDADMPQGSTLHRLVASVATQAEQSIDILKMIDNIEAVWGALENKQAKAIRHYLRNERALSGKQNHLKGYWRADK